MQVASSFAQMQRVTGEAVKAAAQEAIAEALPRELAGPALKVWGMFGSVYIPGLEL